MIENKENRFVDIEGLKAAKKLIAEAPHGHCKLCGDTKPEHNFYPLFSTTVMEGHYETSSLTCNRCALSDERYEETFGVCKEKLY